jgi:hypothetical protein
MHTETRNQFILMSGGYHVGCITECPCIEFSSRLIAAEHLEVAFCESLTVPEDSMIVPECLNHAIAWILDRERSRIYLS